MKSGIKGFLVGIIVAFVVLVILFFADVIKVDLQTNKVNYRLGEGYVQDEGTAIKIAEAVWLPIYGKGIYDERPFVAKLNNDVWTVTGTLPAGILGGVAEIDISKKDGKILRLIHGK